HFKIYQSVMLAITLAQKSIHMTTGFFIPPPDMIRALKNAARRGVDVALLLPSQTDSQLSIDAGHSYYEDLMESGVKIYEVQGLILHAKTAVIDGVWSTVGSSNLDWRSALHNDECNAVILGPAFGNQMEAMFTHDLTYAKRVDPASWDDRPFIDKVHEWKARLVEYFL
ncbi:MAG TPA: phospholipase D-like domain-containing protein, partial [Burkholderiaceae bacterium]|nr:phospholipase D-like domain-containing protein [Burkholderiaceae bacterium]